MALNRPDLFPLSDGATFLDFSLICWNIGEAMVAEKTNCNREMRPIE